MCSGFWRQADITPLRCGFISRFQQRERSSALTQKNRGGVKKRSSAFQRDAAGGACEFVGAF